MRIYLMAAYCDMISQKIHKMLTHLTPFSMMRTLMRKL